MNKKILASIFALVATASMASAAVASCDNVGVPVNVVGLTVTCGGLTFSNFSVVNAANAAGASIDLISATFVNGTAFLNFNPNMAAAAGSYQDIQLFFTVTGGINQIDLGVGGSRATIVETVCSAPYSGAGICGGTQLSTATVYSNTPNQPIYADPFAFTTPVYIFKDIQVDGRQSAIFGAPANGALSGFSQSFHTAVPEPMTLSMMGLGLLGLGLARRRQQAKK
jgi:hypothetical protein